MRIRAVVSSQYMLALSILWCVLIAPRATDTSSDWSVTLYDPGLNALVDVSASGQNMTYLSDIGYQPRRLEDSPLWYIHSARVMATDDEHYLVSLLEQPVSHITSAVITNLVTGEIIPVETSSLADSEIFLGYSLGVFSPDMTEVALPYVNRYSLSGGIVIVDLATGLIIYTLDIDEIFKHSTAWLDDWTNEGIWFSPRCSQCAPPYEYVYHIWNPILGTMTTTDMINNRQNLERLPSTGELLHSENHPDFPLGGLTFPPLLNAVSLYQPNTFFPDVRGQVVYYDGENLDFDIRAHWVANGRAFVVTNDLSHSVVVFRDGHQLTVDYDDEEYFMAMTGAGWLTIDRDANRVRHYVVSDTAITGSTIYHASGNIEVANIRLAPMIESLPPFTIDITPPDVTFCPGALPTRLEPGDWAEVITDFQEPWIGSLILGDVDIEDMMWHEDTLETLPFGARVQVLESPGCSANGGSHVKVVYEDRIGWIQEVYLTQYFLAPVSAE